VFFLDSLELIQNPDHLKCLFENKRECFGIIELEIEKFRSTRRTWLKIHELKRVQNNKDEQLLPFKKLMISKNILRECV